MGRSTYRVTFSGFEAEPELRESAELRVRLAFSRFARELTSVTLKMSPLEAGRDGRQIVLAARGPLFGLFEHHYSGEPRVGVEVVVDQAARRLGRWTALGRLPAVAVESSPRTPGRR